VAGGYMEQVGVFINGFEVHEMLVHGFLKFKNNRVQPGIPRNSAMLLHCSSLNNAFQTAIRNFL